MKNIWILILLKIFQIQVLFKYNKQIVVFPLFLLMHTFCNTISKITHIVPNIPWYIVMQHNIK